MEKEFMDHIISETLPGNLRSNDRLRSVPNEQNLEAYHCFPQWNEYLIPVGLIEDST